MSVFDVFNLFNKDNFISHENRLERLRTCNPCEYRTITNLGLTTVSNCTLCGCFNMQKSKLKESKGGKCPDGRWKVLNT